jgi:hypothetical protein
VPLEGLLASWRRVTFVPSATGASTKELTSRMGHASPRAALIYQHASRERDIAIAAALSDVITAARPSPNAAVLPLRNDADR